MAPGKGLRGNVRMNACWALAGLCVACAGSPTSEAKAPAAAAPPEAHAPVRSAPRLLDTDWDYLEAAGFGVELLVPERTAWTPVSEPRWFAARHAASGAKLSVRTWSARRTVSRAECERELFLAQPALGRGAAGTLLEERAESAPAGFDVWLRLWVEENGEGVALATGAGPGQCYAAVFRTRGDEAKIGSELRLAAEGIFSHVRVVGIEARRAPRPESPF